MRDLAEDTAASRRDGSPAIAHLRRSARFFGAMLAALFAMAVISAWSAGLGFLLFLVGAPVLIGAFLFGGVACVIRGVTAAGRTEAARERALAVLAAPVMMALTVVLVRPCLAAGGFSGTWTRLMANRSHYEAIIARAERGRHAPSANSSFEEDGGVTYVVDAGPPVRVAFNPEGMLDNWSGIIFDPTGEVMLAKGFDPVTGTFAAPDRVTKLFGGDLVACRRLWGHYYDCSFT